jgi:hypothetical protein
MHLSESGRQSALSPHFQSEHYQKLKSLNLDPFKDRYLNDTFAIPKCFIQCISLRFGERNHFFQFLFPSNITLIDQFDRIESKSNVEQNRERFSFYKFEQINTVNAKAESKITTNNGDSAINAIFSTSGSSVILFVILDYVIQKVKCIHPIDAGQFFHDIRAYQMGLMKFSQSLKYTTMDLLNLSNFNLIPIYHDFEPISKQMSTFKKLKPTDSENVTCAFIEIYTRSTLLAELPTHLFTNGIFGNTNLQKLNYMKLARNYKLSTPSHG